MVCKSSVVLINKEFITQFDKVYHTMTYPTDCIQQVRWRHVAWGMALQFVMGLMILRWPVGKAVFQCAGDKVSAFLAFTDKGSTFVFGKLVEVDKIFGFKVGCFIYFSDLCL